MPRLDLTGQKFGRLFVKGLAYVKDGRTLEMQKGYHNDSN